MSRCGREGLQAWGGGHLGDCKLELHFKQLFAFPGCSSRSRNPQTIVSDQTCQVRDMDHWGTASWRKAVFIALTQEREGPSPPLSLSFLILSFANYIPYGPPHTHPTPLCLWCSTKSFLPGHCGQCGVPSSRFLTQKEAAVVCPAEYPQSSPTGWEQRVSETCMGSAGLPSLPDDEVFLEEVPLDRRRSPPDTHAPPGNPPR